MNPETVLLLNQLNQAFYQTVATDFDAARGAPWAGWFSLLPWLEPLPQSIHVLDLGCGNGRWGVFLAEHLKKQIVYKGIDSSGALLDRAAKGLQAAGVSHQLEKTDLLTAYESDERFDLIALFGVMHHIPSFERRRELLHRAAAWLAPDGLLLVTFWAFYEQERFRGHIVAWDAPEVPPLYQGLDLEEGDFLLDWRRGARALRYCHYIDAAESARLMAGLKIVASFEADTCNRYFVIQAT